MFLRISTFSIAFSWSYFYVWVYQLIDYIMFCKSEISRSSFWILLKERSRSGTDFIEELMLVLSRIMRKKCSPHIRNISNCSSTGLWLNFVLLFELVSFFTVTSITLLIWNHVKPEKNIDQPVCRWPFFELISNGYPILKIWVNIILM